MAWTKMLVTVVFLVCVVNGDNEDYDPCKAGMFIKHSSSSFVECHDIIIILVFLLLFSSSFIDL